MNSRIYTSRRLLGVRKPMMTSIVNVVPIGMGLKAFRLTGMAFSKCF